MNNWIDSLFSALPKKIAAEMSEASIDDIPRLILKWNVEQLMATSRTKNAKALSNQIEEQGLSLSKAQIRRVEVATSDASGATLIKLAAGLGLRSDEFFYLYSPQGFDSKGKPIAKFLDINHDLLSECGQDAYTVISDNNGDFDVERFIQMAVSSYRTISRIKKES